MFSYINLDNNIISLKNNSIKYTESLEQSKINKNNKENQIF
jgi:hypothetical protein